MASARLGAAATRPSSVGGCVLAPPPRTGRGLERLDDHRGEDRGAQVGGGCPRPRDSGEVTRLRYRDPGLVADDAGVVGTLECGVVGPVQALLVGEERGRAAETPEAHERREVDECRDRRGIEAHLVGEPFRRSDQGGAGATDRVTDVGVSRLGTGRREPLLRGAPAG